MSPEEQKKLEAISVCIFPTGSRIICDPPVLDTDEDWYVLIKDYGEFDKALDTGYEESLDSDAYYKDAGNFVTYRKGEINLIVTTKKKFFLDGYLATCVAQYVNALDKNTRICIFDHFHINSFRYALKTWKYKFNKEGTNRKARRKHLQPVFEDIEAFNLDEFDTDL